MYDNIEIYLKFGRVSRMFLTHESEGTVDLVFKRKQKDYEIQMNHDPISNGEAIKEYLNYMGTMLLYPMLKQCEPVEIIKEYVDKSRHLFWNGSKASSPEERHGFAQEIFTIVLPIIPKDEEVEISEFSYLLGGGKTHLSEASTMGQVERKGRTQEVKTRLFLDLDGKEKVLSNDNKQMALVLANWSDDKKEAYSILSYTGYEEKIKGDKYDCSVIHKAIQINQSHSKVNMNLKKAYHNIKTSHQININSYNGRFSQLLKAMVPGREDGYLFGSGIASKQLGDIKKRYWYRNVIRMEVPELAIILLIDGSGSMHGARRSAALHSSIILHEVLKKQGIMHAIVEHRACFEEPEIEVNILVDFNARDEQKYNLLQLDSGGDNRDALALFWAERYINQNTYCENKLIIVISDGHG